MATFHSQTSPKAIGESYSEPNYAKELASCLNDYRKNRILCDVILVVHEREYLAHRNVLCAASPYFLDELESVSGTDGQRRTLGSKLVLTNISNDVFEDILNFIYVGEICVGEENVRKLISASDILHMANLKDLSCRFYEKRLCPSNCLSIAALANEFNCESLRLAADQFILKNFLEIARYEEFKSLTCSHLVKIISSDEIMVEREEQIFAAAMEWIHYDFETRRRNLPTILRCIRLLRTSKYFIADILQKDESIMADQECLQIINEANYIFNFPDRKHIFEHQEKFAPRSYEDVSKILIACGGNQERMSANEVLCYVPSQDFWYPLAPLLHSRFVSASFVLGNEIYCIGGKIEGRPTNSIEKYNFAADKWMEVVPFPDSCCNHVACIYNGEMYVIGGGINETSTSVVHKFSVEKGIWGKVQHLNVPRRNASVAVHEFLYVIGGYGPDGQPLASVEQYNPYMNEWSKLFPMNSARACASAACIGNNIFVFGGEYAMWSYYRSAEVFNIPTDEWRSIKDLSIARAYMGISCMGNNIYLVGGMVSSEGSDQYGVGDDEDDFVDVTETKLVECYDISSNSWKKTCSLPVATAGVNCSIISTTIRAVQNRCGF